MVGETVCFVTFYQIVAVRIILGDMKKQQVGIVKGLYRYPVKSMLGESLQRLDFGRTGVIGDRAWALREKAGRLVTAKRTTNMLDFSARFADGTVNSPVIITLPDGTTVQSNHPDSSILLSDYLDREVTLERWRPDQNNFGELDAATIFDDVPIAVALEGKKRQLAPDADRYDLATGTFFDSAHLHLLATGTLDHLKSLIGEDAQTDVRRFRPNILIETPPGQTGFIEDAWLDGTLTIGGVVINEIWPTLRCVMTTLPQSDLPKDPRMLRTIVKQHENHLGVFAAVSVSGSIAPGDAVMFESS